MGYPMTYQRVIRRNNLIGDYLTNTCAAGTAPEIMSISGDLRRLEKDQRDKNHLARYAASAGITMEQVKCVLDNFFGEKDAY